MMHSLELFAEVSLSNRHGQKEALGHQGAVCGVCWFPLYFSIIFCLTVNLLALVSFAVCRVHVVLTPLNPGLF